MKNSRKRTYFILGVIGSLSFVAIWEIIARLGIIPTNYFPPFLKIISHFSSINFLRELLNNILHTLWTAGSGYFLAAFIAIPLGLLIGRSKILLSFLEPILEFLRPLPASAIIPVALLFFGLGWKMTIFIVAFGATWPILVPTTQGARNIDQLFLDSANLLKLNTFQKFLYIVFPASLSFIFAGLRTSLAVSLILAVTAEMIAGSTGIGYYILDMERAFRIEEMYAAIISIGVLGYLLNKAFELIERKVLFWI